MTNAFEFVATTLQGHEQPLREFAGRVLLIVNVASECGFTPQYAGLEALYRRFHDRGLSVLGFACNQFGAQEPGTAQEIAAFCTARYAVSFPMFAKIDVNGPHAHPLFEWLTRSAPGVLRTQRIKWNFTKFLVGRDGAVVSRYAPTTKPEAIAQDIESLL